MSKIQVAALSRSAENCSIKISGLSPAELEKIEAFLAGAAWVSRGNEGIVAKQRFEPLPDPVTDPEMHPFWRKRAPEEMEQLPLLKEWVDEFEPHDLNYAHYTLSGIGAATGDYHTAARDLESYGFIQMRSMRSANGRFCEFWYLPGVWAAQGRLKAEVDKVAEFRKTWEDPTGRSAYILCHEAVMDFLRKNVDFGSVEVSIQRLALVFD